MNAIWTNPERLGGTPCFYGTRVPIRILFDYLAGGYSLDKFLEQYPSVSRDKAEAVLAHAKHLVTEHELAAGH